MKFRFSGYLIVMLLIFVALAGCSFQTPAKQDSRSHSLSQPLHKTQSKKVTVPTVSSMNRKSIHTVANPDSTLVLVNKFFKLPDHYVPRHLVTADVRFIDGGKSEKDKMQRVAASALKRMFDAAKKDHVPLAGVSAYRSFKMQTRLFDYYSDIDGKKQALKYSALPGTSEHETGLAIDVSGISGAYAASTAFNTTPEARWLARHARDFGFIVRYPEGKEQVTGYEYEAWHIRYVGVKAARTIAGRGMTLEEYLGKVPVKNNYQWLTLIV
ncbi:M15 family metallopeptidase [Sporolactobacillus vineae]|uniref:M15 family metallopeptidase n=1 Tax=Sporolactobacillus vineae TaxID=444463 RepID=UPI00037F4553|nr:M15 family metallopeptidase [Sporolactobacillus vineae]